MKKFSQLKLITINQLFNHISCLPCFETVGWAPRRASGL